MQYEMMKCTALYCAIHKCVLSFTGIIVQIHLKRHRCFTLVIPVVVDAVVVVVIAFDVTVAVASLTFRTY